MKQKTHDFEKISKQNMAKIALMPKNRCEIILRAFLKIRVDVYPPHA